MLVSRLLASPTAFGYSIHKIGTRGEYLGSMLEQEGFFARSQRNELWRYLERASDTTFWAARVVLEYRIDLLDLDGTLLRTIRRDAEFYEEAMPVSDDDPMPWLTGMRYIDGMLWVAITVKSDEFQPLTGTGPITDLPANFMDRNVDTVIEVIDLERMRVVVRERFPEFIRGFLPGDTPRVWWHNESEVGDETIEVHQLSIRGGSRANDPEQLRTLRALGYIQ